MRELRRKVDRDESVCPSEVVDLNEEIRLERLHRVAARGRGCRGRGHEGGRYREDEGGEREQPCQGTGHVIGIGSGTRLQIGQTEHCEVAPVPLQTRAGPTQGAPGSSAACPRRPRSSRGGGARSLGGGGAAGGGPGTRAASAPLGAEMRTAGAACCTVRAYATGCRRCFYGCWYARKRTIS